MRAALTVLVASAAVAGVAGTATSSRSDVWDRLHRPFHIPHIRPGAPCPTSSPDTSFDFNSYGVSQGYGPGPAYPLFAVPAEARRASLQFDYPSPYGGSWGGQKVAWFLRPGFGDRVLVRGRQLDGRYRVRFGEVPPPLTPLDELRITSRFTPATTRLRTGGCYGYQIDGPTYSRVIVFKAQVRCVAAPVTNGKVRAGRFTGVVDRRYDVLDGRFRLHVGAFRDRTSGLSQKIPWFLPRAYRGGASLVIRGERLAPPGGTFSQTFQRASVTPGEQVYPSALVPPRAGCWRLRFRTGAVRASLIARVYG